MYTSDKEAIILEHLYYDDSQKQRELADKADISLGMVNAILKRLIEKGWLMNKKINSRNISYVVSPAGVDEIYKRGYQYFKRTIVDIHHYRERLEQLVAEGKNAVHSCIALVGKSDLAFIVEYACTKSGVKFKQTNNDMTEDKDIFVIYSEQYEINDRVDENHWLRPVIMRKK